MENNLQQISQVEIELFSSKVLNEEKSATLTSLVPKIISFMLQDYSVKLESILEGLRIANIEKLALSLFLHLP